MIRKLLYFVRSLFLNFFSTSKERSFIPNLKLLCLGMFLINFISFAQTTTQIITTTGSGSFVVPCGVSSITVEAWGGGGAGGGSTSNTALGGGGGAGGTYASSIITVSSGQTILYSVGAGASGASAAGARGADTWFVNNSTLLAKGGNGGSAPNYATVTGGSGTTTGSIGNTLVKGADGGNATLTQGGAGGRGGNNGGVGGGVRSNSGNGGDGNPGSQPGGGGGGSYIGNNSNRSGGSGGNGQITITYNTPPVLTVSNAGPDQYKITPFTLAANTPGTGNTGTWSIVSGPSLSTSQFAGGDTSNPTSVFTPSGAGTWALNWTITNGCGTSTDQVLISNCSGNLITNGDFSAAGSGWTNATSRGTGIEINQESTYFTNTNNNDSTAELDSQASLRQGPITVIPGVTYKVSFLYAKRPGTPETNAAVDFRVFEGVTITGSGNTSTSSTSVPQMGSFNFTPTSSSIYVEFYNNTAGTTYGTIIDNIVLLPATQDVPVATTVPKGTYKTLTTCVGGSVVLDVDNVSGSGLTYSWSTPSSGTSFTTGTNVKSPTVTFTTTGLKEFKVIATMANGCSSQSSSTFVYVIAAPTVFAVTGGGAYCSGGTGVAVGLAGSTSGISYQLQKDNVDIGSPVVSTGGAINFGLQTLAGSYTVVAKNTAITTACTSNMSGSADVIVRPTLAATISGTTSVCINASSPNVTFTNPQTLPITITYNINGATATTINVAANSTATLARATGVSGSFVYNLVSAIYQSAPGCSNNISGSATITVNPNLSAVGITPNTTQSICGLNSGTLLTAAETGGNGVTLRQWGKRSVSGGTITNISGENGATFTPTGTNLGNGNWLIVCTSTPSCGSAMVSNEVAVSVNPNLPASVSIAASPSGVICAGTSVTFTATPTNGGSTPTYQWFKGLTAVGTGSTYSSSTLVNGDAIKVVMTSNASPCLTGSPATSNTITMTVNPNLSAVGITPNTAQSICGLNSGTLLTAAETGGNGVTLRQWGKRSVSGGTITNISGETGATFTPTGTNLGNGNWLIVCTSTPLCGSAMVSNEVSVSVNPNLLASVSIVVNPTGAICAGTPVTFTAFPTNGGTSPSYQWFNGLTAVGTGSSYSSSTLANTDAIKVVMTSNASPCLTGSPATSNTITMTVNPNLPASVSIAASPSGAICAGTSVTFTATATNGGTTPTYQWFNGVTQVGTGSTYSSTTLANADEIMVRMTSNASPCLTGSPATSNKITMSVNALPGTPITGTPIQPTCASSVGSIPLSNLPSTGTWTITQGGTFPRTFSGTGDTYNVENLAPGNYTFTVQDAANTCNSLASGNVTLNIAVAKTWTGNKDSNWSDPANWSPLTATAPTAVDCVVIPDVATVLNAPAITGVGVVANAYTLNVNNDASLTVNSKNTLKVVGSVTVGTSGSLVFQNDASLVQTTNASNVGNITYNRDTEPVRRYDFTYWSTPIVNTANPYKLRDLSPDTLLDKYNSYDSQISAWDMSLNGMRVMIPAVGYTVRAPQYFSTTNAAVYPAVFTGVPNNGDYSVSIYLTNWSLIGNPYPSAIDADDFIRINHLASPSVDVGALYFWTHNSPPSGTPSADGSYDYTSNDYAVFSLSGSIGTGPTPPPTGEIAACQSFFMKASGSGTVKFTNDMRIDGNNGQFYKTKKSNAIEKNRVWLNFTNAKGAFKQVLVGYIEGASNNWDTNYDATSMNGNSFLDFYSINEALKLSIQGRALPFVDTDRVPLGYKTSVAGDFTIAIDHADGLFNNQAIYLEDKVTGTVTDLRAANYTFTTAIGTFVDRFTIAYTKKTLGTGDFENLENSVFVSIKDKTIKVTATKETIKEVTIYDINGQLLYNKKKVGTAELQIPNLQSSNQVLLVKVTLENDFTTTKKIIFQ